MSRRCVITGKSVMSGNNVSHANNKTRRRFLPNVQDTGVYSEVLEQSIKMKISTAGIRTLEHNGGLDKWIMSVAPTKVDPSLRKLRTLISKKLEEKAA